MTTNAKQPSPSEKQRTILEGSTSTNPFALRKRPKAILSEESAMEQVLELLEYYDIDIERMPAEAAKAIDTPLNAIKEHVRRGSLEVSRDADQKLLVTFNLSDGKTSIVFHEVGARHKLAMDKVKGGESYGRIYALMGSLSGLGSAAIERLPARDLAVVESLGMVFLTA